ncbi:putative retrotransposon gag domain-containing protein [Helianthus debilis subsp. tardiflorus]
MREQRDGVDDFEDEYNEYDGWIGNQSNRQVVNMGNYERQTVGLGALERVNQGNVGYQQYVQPTPIQQQIPQQYHQPDPLNQQPAPRRPVVDIPLPPPVPQMPGQIRPLPRNLHRQAILPEGFPRRNNQGPVRGIESHFRPTIANNPSPAVIPQLQGGRSFEVRTQSISSLPKFHGHAHEETYLHIAAYDARCNTISSQGFSVDDVKLVLFQFTLEDKAQQWFHSLPSASIFTWDEMQRQFLDEFYTHFHTNNARKDIRGFRQQPSELFHEAFNRFKMMLNNCPHHGIYLWELMNTFHEGLTDEDARDVNSISNGTFGTNYEEDDWEYLERTARASKRKAQSF